MFDLRNLHLKPLAHSFHSNVYLDLANQLVLKLYNDRNSARREIFALRKINTRIPSLAPKLISSSLGHNHSFEGRGDLILSPYTLQEFVEGTPLSFLKRKNFVYEKVIAALHYFHQNFRIKNTAESKRVVNKMNELFQSFCYYLKKQSFVRISKRLLTYNFNLKRTYAMSLIHNDLRAKHIFVMSGKNVKLIDWEFSDIGDPFLDLAFLLKECFSDYGHIVKKIEKFYKISKNDLKLLNSYIIYLGLRDIYQDCCHLYREENGIKGVYNGADKNDILKDIFFQENIIKYLL